MKAVLALLLLTVSMSSWAFKEGKCQAYFVLDSKNKVYEEALCAQSRGVYINLNKNGAISSSLCGREWDQTQNTMDLIYVEFKTKRKGEIYKLAVDILRGTEDFSIAKKIKREVVTISRDGKITGQIPVNLKSDTRNISGINYDCQIDQFSL